MISSSQLFRRHSGVTLVELVIALAIIGILSAIAYPNYQTYVIRSNRADAQKALLTYAQSQERYYIANNSYASNTQLPGSAIEVKNYTLSVVSASQTAYVLKATPSTTGANKNDGFLQIDNTGLKQWDKNNNGSIDTGSVTVAQCSNKSEQTWSCTN